MTEQHPIIEGAMSQGRMRQEVSLVVQQELEIAGITEASFAALKEEAQAVAAIEVTDEDTLAQVQKVITKCVRMRSTIKGAVEPGKKYAHQLHKCYTSNEKEFTSTVDAIEAPLKEKKMAFLAEVDRKRKEAEEAEQRRQQERRAFAMQCGFIPDLHEWVNGTTRFTDARLITTDDLVWHNLERSMLAIKEEAEERRRYEEAKMLADAEALRQQQAEIERRQKELEERERKIREAVNEARKNELLALGCQEWKFLDEYEDYQWIVGVDQHSFGLQATRLHTFSDTEWADEILAAKAAVEKRNLALKEAQEKAAREALVQERVERLKAAGWELCATERGQAIGLSITKGTSTIWDEYYVDSIAIWNEINFLGLVEDGQAELARREAARQEQLRQEAEAAARARFEARAAEAAIAEAERVSRMGDAEKWEEFVRAVASAAPKMSSAIGQHAVKRVIEGLDKMTPGILQDLK